MPFSSEAQGTAAHAASHESGGADEIAVGGATHIMPHIYSSIVQGNWVWTASAAQLPYQYTFWNTAGAAVDDEIVYPVFLPKGTYDVYIGTRTTDTSGIFHISFDGVEVGTIDCYSSTAVNNLILKLAGATALGGETSLKLKIASKNASSGGYANHYTDIYVVRIL